MPKWERMQFSHWCFTIDIGDPESPDDWKEWEFPDALPDNTNYIVAQLEIGEECGRVHYQGYMQLRQKRHLKQCKKYIQCRWAHFEPVNGSAEDNEVYCTKDDERLAGPFRLGTIVLLAGQRTDWDRARADIMARRPWSDIAADHFELYVRHHAGFRAAERAIHVPTVSPNRCVGFICELHWGVGGTGKTTTAELANPDHYKWNYKEHFQTYRGEKCVILDEFHNQISPTDFKLICQGNSFFVPVKYGDPYPALWTKVVVTTNLKPHRLFPAVTSGVERAAIMRRFTLIKEYTEADIYKGGRAAADPPSSDLTVCPRQRIAVEEQCTDTTLE